MDEALDSLRLPIARTEIPLTAAFQNAAVERLPLPDLAARLTWGSGLLAPCPGAALMAPPRRRRLLAIDDPLAVGRDVPPAAAEQAGPAEQVAQARSERRALFVRLRVQEADAVARAAFELGVSKQELIGALVRRYVDARSPEGLAALRETLRSSGS